MFEKHGHHFVRPRLLAAEISLIFFVPNKLNDCECRIIGFVHGLKNESRVHSREQSLPFIKTPLMGCKGRGHGEIE